MRWVDSAACMSLPVGHAVTWNMITYLLNSHNYSRQNRIFLFSRLDLYIWNGWLIPCYVSTTSMETSVYAPFTVGGSYGRNWSFEVTKTHRSHLYFLMLCSFIANKKRQLWWYGLAGISGKNFWATAIQNFLGVERVNRMYKDENVLMLQQHW